MIPTYYLFPVGLLGYLVGIAVTLLYVLRRVRRIPRQTTIELDASRDIITLRPPPPLPADATTTINRVYIDDLLAQCKIEEKS